MKRRVLVLFTMFVLSLLVVSVGYAQSGGTTVYLPLVQVWEGAPTSTPTATTVPTATPTTTASGVYSQSGGTVSQSYKSYSASGADQSAVYVTSSGIYSLDHGTINKSGNTSSTDNSSFYGLNAAVLANSGSSITLTNSTIDSSGTGGNGAFAYGAGSKVTLTKVTINATADGGHGVMATGAGTVIMEDVDITTSGGSSSAIATDRGSGTITVTGGTVNTSGQNSAGIYSTGVITVTGTTFASTGAEAAVIEGANSIVLNNSTLSTSKADKWGVMIYQSMSGDADGTEGTFTMTGGSLTDSAATGPLFYVTNSTANINLNGVTLSAGSGVLVKAAAGNWGTSGSNSGTVVLTADGQTMTGNMTADSISTLNVTLKNSSTLSGAIDAANTAKNVTLTLDATSTWNVTANSYLTGFSDPGGISGTAVTNITGNGYTVYYDPASCSSLGGLTYTLQGGGYLKPAS